MSCSQLLSEIRIHRNIRHKYIVQFLHFFEDKQNVYILLELCHNRARARKARPSRGHADANVAVLQTMMDMLKRRKRLTEPEVQFYSIQLLDALRYLHARRIIHRDLKLGNLFLAKDMDIRMGDFGLATRLEHAAERKRTICGTPNYIAPEILEGKDGHSYEVDMWSLGCIIYTLLVGNPPFETRDVKSTYRRIKANMYDFPAHVPLSEEAKSLVRTVPPCRSRCPQLWLTCRRGPGPLRSTADPMAAGC